MRYQQFMLSRDAHYFGRISRGIYVGNGEQLVCKVLNGKMLKFGNKLLFCRPVLSRYCDKIGLYRTILFELIALKKFHSISHRRQEQCDSEPLSNLWRTQDIYELVDFDIN